MFPWGLHMKKSINFRFLSVIFVALMGVGLGSSPSSLGAASPSKTSLKADSKQKSLYQISVVSIDGKPQDLSAYQGKVILIVNTASECGFTPQYAGLEKIYQTYRSKGFTVLGFPSNDFGGQEPGKEQEIKKFCELKYKTTFPLFSKVNIKQDPHPLYAHLQEAAKTKVGWNFGKFLVKKDGSIEYFSSNVTPESTELTSKIEAALKE